MTATSDAHEVDAGRVPESTGYVDTAEFWSAASHGRLLLQYDEEGQKPQWFPRPIGLTSGRRQLGWRESSGNGVLYSWTVTRNAWPGHEHRVPYVCALVDLEEGVRVLANVINVDPGVLWIGQPVQLVWEHLSGEVYYPAFEPR